MDNQEIMRPPFQVRSIGIIENKPLHTTPGTKNGDYMFNFFLAGSGFYKNKTFQKHINKTCLAFFLPDDPGMLVCDHNDPYRHYFFRYNGDYAKFLTHQVLDKYKSQFIFFDNLPAIEAILNYEFIKQHAIIREHLPVQMGLLESTLAHVLTLLLDEKEKEYKKITALSLQTYLQSKLDQKLSLEEISNDFHISSRQLSRISKNYFGISLIQLHEKLKIDLAINLIENGHLKINEIALRLGYSDPLHFSRVFKKHQGVSPVNYK